MVKVKDDYKVSQIANFFGISGDAVRFYDKMGIISPGKDQSNQYRYYNWTEFVDMDYVLRLKEINVPLTEIKKMVNEYSIDEIISSLRTHERDVNEELFRLNYARSMTRAYIENFERIKEKDGILEVSISPTMICRNLEMEDKGIMKDFQRIATSEIPCFTFLVGQEGVELLCREKKEAYDYVVRNGTNHAITMIDDGFLSTCTLITENDNFYIFPPRKCIHQMKIVPMSENHSITADIVKYAKENGYTPKDALICRVVGIGSGDNEEVTYYDMWFPIHDEEEPNVETFE